MKPSHRNPLLRNFVLAATICLSLGQSASAASATWNVATDGDWSVAGNWNPSVPGVTGNATTTDTAGFGGATNYSVYLSGTRSINTVTFSNTGTTALLGGTSTTAANEFLYLFSGVTINAGAGAVTIGDTAGSPTRKVDIRMGSSAITNNSSSLLTIANGLGSRGTGSTTTVTLGGTGNTLIGGAVGPGAGATLALTKSGAGTVTLSGSNTFGGLLNITAGTLTVSGVTNTFSGNVTLSGATAGTRLNLNTSTALGATASALTINGGDSASIGNTSGSAVTIANNNPQAWNNHFTFAGTSDLNMGTGNVTLGGTRQITTSANTLTIGGVIADGASNFGLTKEGAGTLVLANANTYDGITTVNAGVLRLTNANALGSTTGGTVAGLGSLELTGGLTTNSGEILTINNSGDSFTGALRAGTGGGTWAGPISIGANTARIGATAGNTLTITGTIANGASNTFAISGQSGTGVVLINPTTSNSYTGKTDIVRGILRLGKTDALPTGTMLDVDSASAVTDPAVFDLASYSQTAGGLRDGATSSFSGKVTNSVAASTSVLTLNQSDTTFYEGIIEDGAGTVNLVKNGGGTLELNGANTYTGPTSLNAGRINLGGSLASPLTVAAGATIGGEGTSSSSLTFGAGTSTLAFNPATPESLTAASVTTTGATVLVSPDSPVTIGDTYVVLTNTAGFSGSPSPTFKPGSRGVLAFDGNELKFAPAASLALTWKGNAANPTYWDINTTANWNNGTEVFFDLDSVTFDDTATTTNVVIQNAVINVGAGGITVNNPTKDYTISGGSITGEASLVKSGNASLTLSNANSFIGGTTLNAGTLNINNATALGTVAGQFIYAGGTINNTSGVPVTTPSYPLTIDADINFTGSNDLNLGAGATTLGSTTATARTITTTAGTLRLGGVIADGSGGANEITKAGNGTLTLAGASTYTGQTTVSAGTLKLGASSGDTAGPLGSTGTETVVNSGATLDFAGFGVNIEPIRIAGTGVGGNGALVNSGGVQTNAMRFLTLTANASVGASGNRYDIRGASAASPGTLDMAGYTLTKTGSGYFTIVNTTVNPGSGHIDIVGGTLGLHATNTLDGSAANTITVRNTATLDCFQSGTWNAPIWSVLMDAGSSFTNSSGTTAWDGTVTLNGAANLGGGSNLTLNGVVSGASGALTKTGGGTLTLAGAAANTYGGLTTVSAGTLALNKSVGNAVPGNVTVTNTGTMSNSANDQIADTAVVTIDSTSAAWSLNTKTETVQTVDLSGVYTTNKGLVTGIAGKLTVTNLNVAGSGVILNSAGAGQESYIDANTVTNTGGTWVFGVSSGTQSLRVGSGGLTIGNGSTIAVAALAGTADNFISLGGNVTSTAAAATNTISGAGKLNLNATRTLTVADGAAASDLTISTVIANADVSGTGAIVKEGAGTMTLGAANTYTGDTTVNTGTLALSLATAVQNSPVITVAGGATLDASAVTWTLGAAQTLRGNGTVSGSTTLAGTVAPGTVGTTGTLTTGATTLSGTYACDVTAAACDLLTVNGSLTLTGATLAITVVTPAASSYTIATYTGAAPAFTTVTGLPAGYTLDYATAGVIKLVQSGSPYTTWGAAYGLGAGTEGQDLDNDGMSNFEEFAFGLIPNSGSSVNPITSQLSKTTGQFTYQRLAASGLTYTIWTSPDLVTWTPDATAVQSPTTVDANESVQVTLSATPKPLTASKTFVRVKAN